ncbi:MAG: putative 7-carboxy-7-deazaguanine synthase QueE [Ruminococcus flavefaciens]|nr:putative 7-carboxy-7-deazaguanine synthase QueE [Ruminococcus flavefaciens]MCM1230343.1 putative 7-carboxy-7-deazaguanine synthase QueE [Ruminococcus flavefaciens]
MMFSVVEKFVSINGEGSRAGELAVFIRFRKCNLNCSYCDTKWANGESAEAVMMSAEEIARYVRSTEVKNVTLTGGEPLLQSDIYSLIEILIRQGNSVEIETNGSISVRELSEKKYRPIFTLDYKLPDSNMEQAMLTDNYNYLDRTDVVKFVAGSRADLEKAVQIINKFNLTEKCLVYISPVFGKINPSDIVDFMAENKLNGVKLQLQLHKFIWNPEQRGV